MPVPPQSHTPHDTYMRDMRAVTSPANMVHSGPSQAAGPSPMASNANASLPHRGSGAPPLPHVPSQLQGAQLRMGASIAQKCHADESDIGYLEVAPDAVPHIPWPRPHRPQDYVAYKLTVMSYTSTSTVYSSFPVEVTPDAPPCYVLVTREERGYDLLRVLDCKHNYNKKDQTRLVDMWNECPPWSVVLRMANPDEVNAYSNEHAKARQWLETFMRKAVDAKKILVTAVELRFDGREITVMFDEPLEAERGKQRLDKNLLREAEDMLSIHLKVRVRMRRAQEDPPPSALAAAAGLPRHQKPTFLPPFRDPSTNNMITFEYNAVNGLRYWVNDSERPPLQSIRMHLSNGTVSLRFQEQDRGITLPHSNAAKITAELTKLANLAKIRHNLPEITSSQSLQQPPPHAPPMQGPKGGGGQQPQPQPHMQNPHHGHMQHPMAPWGQPPQHHQHHQQMGLYGQGPMHQQQVPQQSIMRFGGQQGNNVQGGGQAPPAPGPQGGYNPQFGVSGQQPQGQFPAHSPFGAPPAGAPGQGMGMQAQPHGGYSGSGSAVVGGHEMSAAGPSQAPQGMGMGANGGQMKQPMLMQHSAPNPQAHPFIPSGQPFLYGGRDMNSMHALGGASGSGSDEGRKTPDSLGNRGVPPSVTFEGTAQSSASGAESPKRPTPPPEPAMASGGQQSPVNMPDGKGLPPPCHYFQSGGCSRGDRCRYLHVYPSEQPTNVHIPERLKDKVRRAISFTADDKVKKAPEPEPVLSTMSSMDKIHIDLDSPSGQIEWLIMNSASQDPDAFDQTVHEFQIIEDEARTTILHSEEAEWHRREGTIMEVANQLKDMLMRHELLCLQISSEERSAREDLHSEELHAWGEVEEASSHVPGNTTAVSSAPAAQPSPPAPTGWYVGQQEGFVRNPEEVAAHPHDLPQILQKQQHFSSAVYRPPPPLIPSSMLSYYQDEECADGDGTGARDEPASDDNYAHDAYLYFKAVNPEEAQLQAAAARASRSAEQQHPPQASPAKAPAKPAAASPAADGAKAQAVPPTAAGVQSKGVRSGTVHTAARTPAAQPGAAKGPPPLQHTHQDAAKHAAPTARRPAGSAVPPTAAVAPQRAAPKELSETQFPKLSSRTQPAGKPPAKEAAAAAPLVREHDSGLVWKDGQKRGAKNQGNANKKRGGARDKNAEVVAKMKMEKARKKLEENMAEKQQQQGVY